MKSVVLFISFTKNNIFLSLTNLKGNTLKNKSLGNKQPKTYKKLNSSFSQFVVSTFVVELEQMGCSIVHLKLRGVNKSRRSIIKMFKRSPLQIVTIHDVTANPHNGCRLKKKRRL